MTVHTNTHCSRSRGLLSLSAFDETAALSGNESKTSKVFFIWFMWGERCKRYGICTKGLFLQSLVKGSHVIIFIYKNLKESCNPKIKTCHCLLQGCNLIFKDAFLCSSSCHSEPVSFILFYFSICGTQKETSKEG